MMERKLYGWPAFAALALLPAFAGCVPTVEQAKEQGIEKGKAHCAAEGKQFVVKEANGQKFDYFFVVGAQATVLGQCVGPGEPGYISPPPEH